jgi:exodeoxyribonuclease V beta subunit
MTAPTSKTLPQFDLLGPLPQGTTVLEASAGTGKTFTIAALAARFVAEGVARLDEMLIVTFSRAATQELRDRVRERLVAVHDGLRDPAAARGGTDAVLRHLAAVDDAEVGARRRRLAEALSSFDSATVATTHQFCQQVLIGLGTAGDVDEGAVLVDNLDDLITEVVTDLYLRKWGQGNEAAAFKLDEAVSLALTVVHDSQAVLLPEPAAGDDGVPAVRARFAAAVRREVERRKRMNRVLGFDDLLTRLKDTLADPATGSAATVRLRGKYKVALVDEFQDTDPVQWDILRLAFHGSTTLVLIGDPKQAIYAFRGADVHAYLAATQIADHHATLGTNWRSDADLLHGLDALFRGCALGDTRIRVHPVAAAFADRGLDGTDSTVQVRVVTDPHLGRGVDASREAVTADVVNEVVGLLTGGTAMRPRDGSPSRPVEPGDIAVVVRTNTQLGLVRGALTAAGVPSVQRTTSSVFQTAAGADWVVLLEALEQPHRTGRVRRLAVSPWVGWDAAGLEANDVDGLSLRLRDWVRTFDERGVAALQEAVSRDQQLPSRLLAQIDGERQLTDLRHVGEALHAVAMAERLGLTAVLEWLRKRVEESAQDSADDRSRRLESDAAAVQLMTVHASKGLEFPVVFVPFGWDRYEREPAVPLFHEAGGTRRMLNVGGRTDPMFRQHCQWDRSEDLGEDLRLLYVALTRAQNRAVAWWAPSPRSTRSAPLNRLLFTRDPAAQVPDSVTFPQPASVLAALAPLELPGRLSIAAVVPAAARIWQRPDLPDAVISAATFDRAVDVAWRRTSYSALTAAAHDAPRAIGSEPEVEGKDDEPETAPSEAAPVELAEVPSPMADLPGGTGFGTFVHAVLEMLDPTAADLRTELTAQVAAQSWRIDSADQAAVVEGLLPALATPFGPAFGDVALCDVAPADRLTELDFELPLCGGDSPAGAASVRDLAAVLRKHLAPDDPLAGYADLLDDPRFAAPSLRGYLGGSIDAVLRVDGRYAVIDYKTNRLAERDTPLTAWHYRREAMVEAMLHAHYPLQALLYQVALHRFLRWRLSGYDPATHLGGAVYLFLRGMCGPGIRFADGAVPGVFVWQPPAALVVATSDLLAGGAR